jgi:hypothetical protein
VTLAALSNPSFHIFDELCQELVVSPELSALCDSTAVGDRGEAWRIRDNLILHNGRVFVPSASTLLPEVL